jgi:hypothetical protein
MFFLNRYRRLKFISSRNNFQMQITISFFILDFVSLEKYLSNSDFFQISRLQLVKNYRLRICYQNTTRNQSPKSELLSTAKRYQMLQFIKREQVSFFFLLFLLTSCGMKKCRITCAFVSPEDNAEASVKAPNLLGFGSFL